MSGCAARLDHHLQEVVFGWRRRRHTRGAFENLLSIKVALPHAFYRDFVDRLA